MYTEIERLLDYEGIESHEGSISFPAEDVEKIEAEIVRLKHKANELGSEEATEEEEEEEESIENEQKEYSFNEFIEEATEHLELVPEGNDFWITEANFKKLKSALPENLQESFPKSVFGNGFFQMRGNQRLISEARLLKLYELRKSFNKSK